MKDQEPQLPGGGKPRERNLPAINRRDFIKASVLATLGMQMPLKSLWSQEGERKGGQKRIQKGEIAYRRLGRTGLMISEISLGGSPVPSEPVFKKAIEMGVNYVDTSSAYSNGNSERLIGEVLKGRRDKFYVATKFHTGRRRRMNRQELIETAEGSLKRLQSDWVDILLVHGASSAQELADEEVLAAFDRLKKDGKIRFTGVSCHRDPVGVLVPAIESGNYDMITVAYNAYSGTQVEEGKVYGDYLKLSGMEKVIRLAKEKDVGVVAMKTMAGGDRQDLGKYKSEGVSLPQAKLKWVLQNEGVSAAITEMLTFDMLQENLAACRQAMTGAEKGVLHKHVRATWKEYCRMCGTCLPHCPQGVEIPDILRYFVYHQGHGKTGFARLRYRSLPAAKTFLGCSQCGRCEAACPYGLPVVQKLYFARQILA